MIIETGLSDNISSQEYSSLWESGLMDAFFDAGHIVSNAPKLRLTQNPAAEFPNEAQVDFDEAIEGGAEYFVLAMLNYQYLDGKYKPRDISLKVFTVSPRKLIYEQRVPGSASLIQSEELANAKKAARTIISRIN